MWYLDHLKKITNFDKKYVSEACQGKIALYGVK